MEPSPKQPRSAKVDLFEVRSDDDLSGVLESRMTKNQLRLCDARSAPCKDRARLEERLATLEAAQAPRHASSAMLLSADGRAHDELALASPARKLRVGLALR